MCVCAGRILLACAAVGACSAFRTPVGSQLPSPARASPRHVPLHAALCAQQAAAAQRSSHRAAADLGSARAILELDHVNVCCVQRAIAAYPSASAWSSLPQESSASVDYLDAEARLSSLTPILVPLDDDSWRGAVREEIVELGAWFQETMACRAVETRIEVMMGKTRCQLYHTDKVPLRLSLSLCGPGTEFLPEEALDRSAMLPWRRRGKTIDEINDAMVTRSSSSQVAEVGQVLLIKGESFASSAAFPRSRIALLPSCMPSFTLIPLLATPSWLHSRPLPLLEVGERVGWKTQTCASGECCGLLSRLPFNPYGL